MSTERRVFLWVVVFACLLIILYLLRSAILPFVAGMAVAYLLDPVADRLERVGVPRTLASLLIVGGFVLIFLTILVALLPTIVDQVTKFVASVPDLAHAVSAEGQALLRRLRGGLTAAQQQEVNAALSQSAGKLASWLGDMAGRVVSGGAAIFNLISLIFIMPIVAFYLLRDWDRIVAYLDGLIPHTGGEAIRKIMADIDKRLSGFVRGQAIVCLLLGIWYAAGLTIVGLNFGLVVGLAAGILTIIPFVGNILGFGTSMAIAFTQFDGWIYPAVVAGVFMSGQMLEGNFVTPKILGDKVGLHPVWLLFAVMAGSALLGITGALLAVPAAAAIGVIVRFLIQQYRESPLYQPQKGEAFMTSGPVSAPMAVTILPSTPSVDEAAGSTSAANAGPPAHP
ncbi:MAG: AI-2E family transporter [Rhodospirillales bacterium]